MKRLVLTLTLLSFLFTAVVPNSASAGDWYGGSSYPGSCQNGNPVLRNLVIGGALVGLGYLAGRLTAPRPSYGYQQGYGNYPPVGPQFQPNQFGGQPGFAPHGWHRF